MKCLTMLAFGLCAPLVIATALHAEDWPRFRGPTGQGISTETNLPLHWDKSHGVAWKTALPGRGWSSPCIFGDKIFLTATSEDGVHCHAIAVDAKEGKILWDVQLFDQTPTRKEGHNSYATPTPATDGSMVYVVFGEGGIAALNFGGTVAWKNFDNNYYSQHGMGTSPVLYKDTLFVTWDWSTPTGPDPRVGWQKPWDKAFILALDKRTGKEKFKAKRGLSRIGHTTPIIVDVEGKPQLISVCGDVADGFDPEDGQLIWSVKTGGEACVPSPVVGDGIVFVASGFPTPIAREPIHAALRAFRLGGKGDVTKSNFLWEETKSVAMIPSPVFVDHLLYGVKEDGTLLCLEASTGHVVYRQRLEGGYFASPVYADGRIYFLSDDGNTTVIEPGRQFRQIAYNELHEPTQASMAVSNGRLFIRTQDNLYCITK
jgi:outer membrane protein assembly factor BamB